MHDPNVRGAAKTAGKLMVYGRGESMTQFMQGTLKYNKDCYIMDNASNMDQFVPQIQPEDEDDKNEEDEDDKNEENEDDDEEYSSTENERKIRRTQKDDSDESEPDIFNMQASAVHVKTPGT